MFRKRHFFWTSGGRDAGAVQELDVCTISRNTQRKRLRPRSYQNLRRKFTFTLVASPCKQRVRYEDVYSSSSGAEEELQGVEELSDFELKKGQFVLVKFNQHAYVCIVQNFDPVEGEVTVMAMKSKNNYFIPLENDVSDVQLRQVLEILPNPEIRMTGARVQYVFPKEINVIEQ